MTIEELIERLRTETDSFGLCIDKRDARMLASYIVSQDAKIAGYRKDNEQLMKELCEKENMVREAEGRVQELEIQLGRQKSEKQHEWISVEDRLPEPMTSVLVYDHKNKRIAICSFGNPVGASSFYSHWMPLPESPKPKEPTFKDKFLEAFPKAQLYSDGIPIACRANIFGEKCLMKSKCSECWNQPYFEEEGEQK